MLRNGVVKILDIDAEKPKEKSKPRIFKVKDVEASPKASTPAKAPAPVKKAPVKKVEKIEEAKPVAEVKAPVKKVEKIEEVKVEKIEEPKPVAEVKKGRVIFEKGSEEAKQWGAMMREKRLAKKAEAKE